MKKSILFVLVLAVVCMFFSNAFAYSLFSEIQSARYEPQIEPSELNSDTFGRAFAWGTPYETVLGFLRSVPGLKWHESSEEKIYVSNQTANLHYYFVFENDKLYEIQCLHLSPNKANSDLPGFVDDFIDEYNLLDLEEYTESERMNSKANKNPGTIIVADKDTVYCVYPHTVDPSSKSIPYASLLLRDKKYSEQKATSESPSAADAGNLENETTNTPESTHAQQDKQDVKKSNDSAKIGTCKYESHLKTGDKAEVINVTALLMYESPNGKQVEGVSAFPGKEITIIGDPYCKDDVVWWKIDFLGYKGWVKEMNEEGTYYIKKR